MKTEELKKSCLAKKQKKSSSDSPSSPPPSPTSFSSLPYDLTLNCLARTSRTHAPILSHVSKSFRSILASPDLEAARSHVGKKPEKCLYVCLNLNNNPTWFVLSTTHKHKLIPLPLFPNEHPNSSTVVSIGSDIYLIGGFFEGTKTRSKKVFLLDCKSHQWRQLPNMRVSRKEPAARVINGKICVNGGCSKRYYNKENYEEIYDPKTQTWKPLWDNNIFPHSFVIPNRCLVQIKENDWIQTSAFDGKLFSRGMNPIVSWSRVCGLEGPPSKHFISVANPGGGSSVTVWWKECFMKTEYWCAEISLTKGPYGIILGFIEWSENVFTFNGCETHPDFFLHSVLVTHDHQ